MLLATSYGPDEHGRLLSDHLVASGVVLATEPHVVQHTSVARARIGADGAASYDFDVQWQTRSGARRRRPGAPRLLARAGAGPGADAVAADLVDRLAPTTTVTYDVNARPAITGTGPDVVARVERLASRADLVKASDEDLAALWPAASREGRRPAPDASSGPAMSS